MLVMLKFVDALFNILEGTMLQFLLWGRIVHFSVPASTQFLHRRHVDDPKIGNFEIS